MYEYGAAEPRLRGVVIVADDNDYVVEIILAPECFVRSFEGQPNKPIIGAVSRVVAPSVVGGEHAHW